jgi:hypothetical protein
VGAFLGKPLDASPPDSGAGTCDDCHLILQPFGHFSVKPASAMTAGIVVFK